MRKLLSIILLGCLALSLVACGGAKESKASESVETVKIAYLPITHSLAVLKEAKELEKNENIQVELVKYGSWPELLDALNSGQVDGASVLIELAMKSRAEGIGIKAVALGTTAPVSAFSSLSAILRVKSEGTGLMMSCPSHCNPSGRGWPPVVTQI